MIILFYYLPYNYFLFLNIYKKIKKIINFFFFTWTKKNKHIGLFKILKSLNLSNLNLSNLNLSNLNLSNFNLSNFNFFNFNFFNFNFFNFNFFKYFFFYLKINNSQMISFKLKSFFFFSKNKRLLFL